MLQPNKVYGYTVQCRDPKSGKLGSFIIHNEPNGCEIYGALSPVFPDLASFYKWCHFMGIKTNDPAGPWTCETTRGLTDLDLFPNWPSDELTKAMEN